MQTEKDLSIPIQTTLEEIPINKYLKQYEADPKQIYNHRLKVELLLNIYHEKTSEIEFKPSVKLRVILKAVKGLLKQLYEESEGYLRFDTDLIVPTKKCSIVITDIPFLDMKNKKIYLIADTLTLREDKIYTQPQKFYSVLLQKLPSFTIHLIHLKGVKYKITKLNNLK